MAFITKIKMGGITNLSDARFAAAAGIDYIGFCFDRQSDQYIAPIKAKEIIDWTTGSIVVGEFGNQALAEIADISELLNIDVIEVDNRLLPDELLSLGKAIIKKIDVALFDTTQLETELKAYNSVADAFHFYRSDAQELNTQELIKWCADWKIIMSSNLPAHEIKNKIVEVKPYGINLVGGDEERPGVKDFDTLNDILELLTIED